MMLVEADTFDAVPRSCLMAEEALIHLALLSMLAVVIEIILRCIM